MLYDAKARGMAREFLGNWLDFRRFDTHNGVDREEFPSFDDRLRQSMADEPIEYFLELLRRNGSIMELLESDHIVVDEVLAKHYGVENYPEASDSPWLRIENAGKLQRGGLLPMAVFLTQNSPGQRTSPVKRGYWVVRKLLGEKIPPPPPNVPELPASEHQLGDLTIRQLLLNIASIPVVQVAMIASTRPDYCLRALTRLAAAHERPWWSNRCNRCHFAQWRRG